jgi:hypothetical protein
MTVEDEIRQASEQFYAAPKRLVSWAANSEKRCNR